MEDEKKEKRSLIVEFERERQSLKQRIENLMNKSSDSSSSSSEDETPVKPTPKRKVIFLDLSQEEDDIQQSKKTKYQQSIKV